MFNYELNAMDARLASMQDHWASEEFDPSLNFLKMLSKLGVTPDFDPDLDIVTYEFPQIAPARYFTHGLELGIVVPIMGRRFQITLKNLRSVKKVLIKETKEELTPWSDLPIVQRNPHIEDWKYASQVGIQFFGNPKFSQNALFPLWKGKVAVSLFQVFNSVGIENYLVTLDDETGLPEALFYENGFH